jgi:4-diphosphocytidyl-2-C-methyl-D-erythritol kinase
VYVIPAYAKVNLALEVVRRRADGWHDIESVLAPIDWHDLIGLELGGRETTVRVSGPASRDVPGAAGASAAADNLAARAADALLAGAEQRHDSVRVEQRCLDVWVHKRVPAGAGLGGGSADAAATLLAGARVLQEHGVRVDTVAISTIAAALGSDVPALLSRFPAHVSGRGELVARIDAPTLHLVIAFLGPSSTRDTYGALRPEEMTGGGRVRGLIARLRDTGDPAGLTPSRAPAAWDGLLGSALEAPAFRLSPSLCAAAQRLRDSTPPVRWHMTGSGGAFFAVMPEAAAADRLARRLQGDGLLARACRTLASSPLRS